MPSIHLVRPAEPCRHRFPWTVVVNDRHRVALANGESATVEVERFTCVQAKTMWCGSERVEFTPHSGPNVTVEVRGDRFLNRRLAPMAATAFVAAVATNAFLPQPFAKWFSLGLAAVTLVGLVFAVTAARNRWIALSVRGASPRA